MKSNETSIERVQNLVEQAERLRLQTVAVPLRDLRALLGVCQGEIRRQRRDVLVANRGSSGS